MEIKEILGGLSLAVVLLSYIPIYLGVFKRALRPHMFTWLIWGVIMVVGFLVQEVDGAGAGAWATLFAGMNCLCIAVLGFFYGEKIYTRSDWIALFAALSAIPLWVITKNPLFAICLVIVIDACGYYPTYRKSWNKPWDESALSYALNALAFVIGIIAIENYSYLTFSYPAFIVLANLGLVLLLLLRRPLITRIANG